MSTKRMTKTQRLASERFFRAINDLDEDLRIIDPILKEHIPRAWMHLERDLDVEEKKVKVTLLLDESVARFYRALGRGYQARINRVLATYAQLKIARLDDIMTRVHGPGKDMYERLGLAGPVGWRDRHGTDVLGQPGTGEEEDL